MIPQDLLDIEDDLIFGSSGGFRECDGLMWWYNVWIGDAPGDEPSDTTQAAYSEASNAVEALGYKTIYRSIEHDYACFTIEVNANAE